MPEIPVLVLLGAGRPALAALALLPLVTAIAASVHRACPLCLFVLPRKKKLKHIPTFFSIFSFRLIFHRQC